VQTPIVCKLHTQNGEHDYAFRVGAVQPENHFVRIESKTDSDNNSQAPEYDVFRNVNAVAWGWTNYYRYAHNFAVVGGKLSMVIYWQVAHYLGKRHRCSIAKMMRDYYARDPKTGCKGWFTPLPGKPRTPDNRLFIWHKVPLRLQLGSNRAKTVQDQHTYLNTSWAQGRSQHKKLETQANANLSCEYCGATGVTLYVHHPNRLVKAERVKKGWGHVAQSGFEQQTKLLCRACHMAHHHFVSS
jgi:hypothetical protein